MSPTRRLKAMRYCEGELHAVNTRSEVRGLQAEVLRRKSFGDDRCGSAGTLMTYKSKTRYIIALERDHNLGANTILHNAIIVTQFFKRQGRAGITRGLQLPERITPLPREYRTADLAKFFKATYDSEKALFSTFLLTGLRELEVVHLIWTDVSFELQTVRVTAKPELGFTPIAGRSGRCRSPSS
jgi:integrase